MDFPPFVKLPVSHKTPQVRTTGGPSSFMGPSSEAAELMRNLTPNCDKRGPQGRQALCFFCATSETNICLAHTTLQGRHLHSQGICEILTENATTNVGGEEGCLCLACEDWFGQETGPCPSSLSWPEVRRHGKQYSCHTAQVPGKPEGLQELLAAL